jgi:hypothetical protein
MSDTLLQWADELDTTADTIHTAVCSFNNEMFQNSRRELGETLHAVLGAIK